MLITEDIIGTAIVSIFITLISSYVYFRITLESRIKDMEHKLQLLEPMTKILIEKGSEQVEKVFKGRK